MKKEKFDPDSVEHPDTVFGEDNIVIPWENLSKREKLLALATLGFIRPRENQKSVGGGKPGHGKNQRRNSRGGNRSH